VQFHPVLVVAVVEHSYIVTQLSSKTQQGSFKEISIPVEASFYANKSSSGMLLQTTVIRASKFWTFPRDHLEKNWEMALSSEKVSHSTGIEVS